MNTPNLHPKRRDALRRQLVSMTTPGDSGEPTGQRAGIKLAAGRPGDPNPHRMNGSGKNKRIRIWLGAGIIAAATAVGATALMSAPEDRFEDASRIIDTLSRAQTEADVVPPAALKHPEVMGIDPSETRLLGHSTNYTYYGAPASEASDMSGALTGKRICIISVPIDGKPASVGCTLLKSFESYGLKVESPDRTEAAWLMVPQGMKNALASTANEPGWTQQAPNLLIRSLA